jgi:hypothetical protein
LFTKQALQERFKQRMPKAHFFAQLSFELDPQIRVYPRSSAVKNPNLRLSALICGKSYFLFG